MVFHSAQSNRRLNVQQILSGLLLLSLFIFAPPLYAYPSHEIALPNGEYIETNVDLRVKAIGGHIEAKRVWTNSRWYINPEWADLKFTYDDLDNSVKAIDRAGAIFERSGDAWFLETKYRIQKTDTGGYRWSNTRGNWATYDNDGRILATGDRNTTHATITYNLTGQRTEIKDIHGNTALKFTYNSQGLLETISDRTDRKVTYTYTGEKLTKVTDVLGNDWHYTYDNYGQIETRTDAEGNTIKLFYVEPNHAGAPEGTGIKGTSSSKKKSASNNIGYTGKPIRDVKTAKIGSYTDAEGNRKTYQYQYNRQTRKYTVTKLSPEGRKTTTVYDKDGRVLQNTIGDLTTSTVTRESDKIEAITDARGLITRHTYDGNRNILKTVYPDGSSVHAIYNAYDQLTSRTDELGVITKYAYDQKGNLIKLTEAQGLPEERVTEYAYDNFGQMLTESIKGKTADQDSTVSLLYDEYGNVSIYTDPEGNKTTYTYDITGEVLTETDPMGAEARFSYDLEGKPLTAVLAYGKPEQQTFSYQYDKVGNLIVITDPRGNATKYQYSKSNLMRVSTDPLKAIRKISYNKNNQIDRYIDEENREIVYDYDSNGRLYKIADGAGNVSQWSFGLSSEGTSPFFPQKIQHPTFTEHVKYDPRDRMVISAKASEDDSLVYRYGYDARGFVSESTDPNGFTTFYEYDGLGRVIKITDRINASNIFTYDTRDNIVSFQDAKGNITRFDYDRADRLIREEDPLGKVTQYTYDKNDNIILVQNANGSKIAYFYDALDRLIQSSEYLNGENEADKVTNFTYDADDNLVGWSDGAYSSILEYDANNQLLGERINYGSFTLSYAYTYTPSGQIKTMTGPDGVTVSYTYDGQNELISVNIPGQGEIKRGNYKWEKPQKIDFPGDVSQDLGYDAFLNLTLQNIKKNSELLGSLTNQYDKREQVSYKVIDGKSRGYAYDAEQRLILVNGDVAETFVLDAMDNRVQHSGVDGDLAYNSLSQLLQKGEDSYEYDASGNLIKHTKANYTRNFKYDALNRLTEVRDGADAIIARYGYDPMDFRLWKEVGGEKTYYLYADQGLIAEVASNGQIKTNYGWEPNRYNSTAPLYIKQNGAYAYLHYDDLGTPLKATNNAGNIVWSARYDNFGKAEIDAKSTITVNLRFPGQYYDVETGFHYNERRYYDPDTGRYITKDPLGLASDLNLYVYVRHDPINLTDPTGEAIPAVAGAYARCVLQCAGMTCLMGLIGGDDCGSPCDGAEDCFLDCLNPFNWLGPGPRMARNPCRNSFTGETLVHTESGNKRIDEIQIGEKVYAYSEIEESVRLQPVTDVISSYREQLLIHITLENGEKITATHEHPFFTLEGWRAAILLKAGGQLDLKGRDSDADKHWITITDVEQEYKTVPVYNLEVVQDHTYFVGKEGVLVHNARRGGKYQKPPNANKKPPPPHRLPKDRQRNMGVGGEEHSMKPKGGFMPKCKVR